MWSSTVSQDGAGPSRGGANARQRCSLCAHPLPGFPAPNLTLSEPEVSEGTLVTVECEAQAGTTVSLEGVSSESPAHRAEFRLNASAADHRRSFSCSAALIVAGHLLHKNQIRELRVLCELGPLTSGP